MISFPLLKNKYSKLIYNGTDIRESEKCNYQKPEGEILILAISGLIKIKNIQVLIKCLEILQKKVTSKVKFRVAGDGPLHDHLKEMIKERNLECYFDLIGYDDNIGGLMTLTDIFVHPCYDEGFGIAVAEAMIAEKPIIVANAGALPELIENEKTGLIVDPFKAEEWANAIIRLKNDKIFANQLAHNAKKKAEAEFSIEKFVANYEQLYHKLLN
jgi:glycosyltransferase involved in cell wall biosynthesis